MINNKEQKHKIRSKTKKKKIPKYIKQLSIKKERTKHKKEKKNRTKTKRINY